MLIALALLVSYLIGSIPFGYLVARARGVDIFAAGSGNIGATNVGRVLGRKYGLLVFALDVLKGALPTLAAARWRGVVDAVAVGCGLAAFLGHLFPVTLGFRGGKGVATGAGVVAVLMPVPAAVAFGVWLVVVAATRTVSLASISAALALLIGRLLTAAEASDAARWAVTAFAVAAVGLIVVRHRANVARVMAGTENRIPESGTMQTLLRSLHVLAVGLWFGAGVFFTFGVALPTFANFKALAEPNTPDWLPVERPFEGGKPTQLAGAAVGPLFKGYFATEAGAGLVAVVTALAWWRHGGVHKARVVVLVLALGGVAANMAIRPRVNASIIDRHRPESDPLKAAAEADFKQWHGASVAVDLCVITLAAVAAAMAGAMPDRKA